VFAAALIITMLIINWGHYVS